MSIPVRLSLKDRHVYIIGAGSVAYRKVCLFQNEGARITILAPEFDLRFQTCEGIERIEACFDWNLISEDAFLLYLASDDRNLHQRIIQECKQRHILCGCAHQGFDNDIQSMAVYDSEWLQTAISTKGNCPGADRAFLKLLEPQLSQLEKRTAALGSLRKTLLRKEIDTKEIAETLKLAATLDASYIEDLCQAIVSPDQSVLVLAYHGIANVGNSKEPLQLVKEECENKLNISAAMAVFLSEKIVKKANAKGYAIAHIKPITEVLEHLAISYVIQPMLIQEGKWYTDLQETYPDHTIGKPLCLHAKDVEMLLTIARKLYPSGTLLCLYHPSNADTLKDVPQQKDCILCPIDTLPDSFPMLDELHILPLFLFAGYHVQNDIQTTWLPFLYRHANQIQLHTESLLMEESIRKLFYKRITDFLDISYR